MSISLLREGSTTHTLHEEFEIEGMTEITITEFANKTAAFDHVINSNSQHMWLYDSWGTLVMDMIKPAEAAPIPPDTNVPYDPAPPAYDPSKDPTWTDPSAA